MRFYSHLSDDERDQIAILRAAGRSMGAIARALGRAKTTISRELQRNALPSGGYSPLHAAGAYQLRRRREAILEREAALRLFVGDRLAARPQMMLNRDFAITVFAPEPNMGSGIVAGVEDRSSLPFQPAIWARRRAWSYRRRRRGGRAACVVPCVG